MFVTALKSFDHNGRITRGSVFECSDLTAHALKRAKLVLINDESEVNPSMAACIPPSALPPVPALPQTIAKQLESGDGKVTTKLKKKPGRKKKLS